MPRTPFAFIAATSFGVSTCVALAFAQEPAPLPHFSWQAPTVCPDRQTMVEEIRGLRRSDGVGRGPLRVSAVVAQLPSGKWGLLLMTDFDGQSGKRTLEGDSCEEVAHAAAVMVALALDEQTPSPPTATGLSKPDAPKPSTPAAPPAAEPVHDSVPWLLGARPFALLDLGTLPDVSAGFGLALMTGRSTWKLEPRFTMLAKRSEPISEGRGEVEVGLMTGGLWGCYEPSLSAWSLGLCAGSEIGSMSGTSSDILTPSSDQSVWVGVSAEGRLGLRIAGPLALRSALQLGAAPLVPEARVAGHDVVYRPSRVFVRGWLGLELSTNL